MLPALERWNRIDRLLEDVLDLPAEERSAYLCEACGDDHALRDELERLLAADSKNVSFLESPPVAGPWMAPGAVLEEVGEIGARVGPYRLLAPIGMGGMGLVYLAERDDEHFEQRVAVKLLRRGFASSEAVERFRRERQALAHLQHPNIARLYDGGTTEDHRPYLVIEHVRGLPLDAYCDTRRLGVEARLRLFVEVCSAVEHAHRHLLVHRDLKPANILVGEDGRPKLLDFGIAKDLAGVASERVTLTGERAMTPSYASPEQVRGETVTTATDVYSLGVILYQLLSGRSPYRLASAASFELERAICEQEPEAASAALRRPGAVPSPVELAELRGVGPRTLAGQLQGDLDAIVAKALRKEPARRYGSVDQLAQDIELHLAGKPVGAQRDTVVYRCRKFLARHRYAAAAAAVVVCVLAALLVALVANTRQTRRERDKAEQTMRFLVGTISQWDPYQGGKSDGAARALLEQAAERFLADSPHRPEVRVPLLTAIGRVYLGLGLPDRVESLLVRAEEGLDERSAEHQRLAADLLDLRSQFAQQQGHYAEAAELAATAVTLRRKVGGDDLALAASLRQAGLMRLDLGRLAEAESDFREALGLAQQSGPAGTEGVAAALGDLAVLERSRGNLEPARELLDQSLEALSRAHGAESVQVAVALCLQSNLYVDLRRGAEAEAMVQRALRIMDARLDPDHPDRLGCLTGLALARNAQDDFEGATAAFRRSLDGLRRRLGPDHPTTLAQALNLGALLARGGQRDEAASLLEAGLATARQVLPPQHDLTVYALREVARMRMEGGRVEEGFELEKQALAMITTLHGEDYVDRATILSDLATMYMSHRRPAEAEPYYRQALALRERVLPPGQAETALTLGSLGTCLREQKRFIEAEPLLMRSHQQLVEALGAEHRFTALSRLRLYRLYDAWGKPELAARFGPPPPMPSPAPAQKASRAS